MSNFATGVLPTWASFLILLPFIMLGFGLWFICRAFTDTGGDARQAELLRALVDEVGPTVASLATITRRAEEAASLSDTGVPADGPSRDVGRAASAAAGRADTPAPRAPLPLTRRETEVLGLLAQGLNNREIAGVMWLSDRTVERHITSLYRKIGVARRSEATAFALRHGFG